MVNKMPGSLFVVAFGGPTPGCCGRVDPCPGEAFCFVSGIFGHNPARQARVDEVVAHYRELGGFSRFNEITETQARAVGEELARRGHKLRVVVGYDHWHPHIQDKVADLQGDFVTLVMSPHQSSVSWDGYLKRVSEGLEKLPENKRPRWAGVVEPWWNKAGFIEALADRARHAARKLNVDFARNTTGLLLSAHAVPMPVARTAPYVDQIRETARLVAERLNAANWLVGFQSAPSDSRIEWTTPFLDRAMDELAEAGAQAVVAVPVGFLCDNVEVLYDLGIEGARKAEALGVPFAAAEAVNDHPAFIGLLADQVEAALKKA
ncbi:MAG: ferrochelatase [Planctomycetes bacterium]|nr:ferrochelatase [Planctomycetota bacterium]